MARLLAERLAAVGATVAAVVDERKGIADTEPFDKITLSEEKLAKLGISGLPDDWGWFCGDLCYYVAANERPGFTRYALIESDVFLPEQSAASLVQALSADPSEAIAAQLGTSDQKRRYSQALERFGLDPSWGCIFPLSRVSGTVIEAMLRFRVEHLLEAPGERLNDEAILAGAVLRGGFSFASLEDVVPDLVSADTFHTNPPHLLEALAADASEKRLFHPVVPFELVMKRLRTGEKAYSRRRLRKVIQSAPIPMKKQIQKALKASDGFRMNLSPDLVRMHLVADALQPDRRIRILDVGANPLIEGEVSYQRLLDQGYAEVIGFEPQTDALSALNKRKSEAETYLPHALGDGTVQTLRLTKSPGFSSIFPADPDSARLLGFPMACPKPVA